MLENAFVMLQTLGFLKPESLNFGWLVTVLLAESQSKHFICLAQNAALQLVRRILPDCHC
jgi:hypothetical protein